MDLQLSDEHRMIRDMARDFAQKEIAPIAAEHDETGEFPRETIAKMGAQGFMGIAVPEEYGGAGMDTLAYVLAMIEIAKVDASHAVVMSVCNSLYCYGFMRYGTEEQKQKYLRPVASGEAVGAYALTEPQSGSDAGNMRVTSILSPDGSHYVINGTKSWITSGPVAKYILLFAQTDPDASPRYRGVSALIIDTDEPGFERGKTEPKLGIRASATCEIHFEDYKCPVERRLGAEGEGFKISMAVLDAGRIGIASQALGIAEAAYEASVEYAREREAFGKKLAQFQMIQQKLADMKMRIDASRLLIYQAALAKQASKETHKRYTLESCMAKTFASETAMWVTTQAIQIHAGMGYSKELPIERYFRDAKVTEIYEGTSEIQRMVIARLETGLR
ncbi:MAG: acyl-CoA dehydrogenase [Chloroflexi bacterium]|nr:MAG: acyl-CoA dehydrogenase [Chloroflexota bacterium]